MKRPALLLLLSVVFLPVFALGKEPDGFARYSSEMKWQKSDQDDACACCMACKAATKEIQPSHNGKPAENGCKDCCARCGTENLPTDREKIPEQMK